MTTPKAMKRATRATERRVAAELGGRTTFCSGSGTEKADVRVDAAVRFDGDRLVVSGAKFRVESKRTWTRKLTISHRTWVDVVMAAGGAYPVIHIQLPLYEFALVESSVFLPFLPEPRPEPSRFGCRSITLSSATRIPSRFVLDIQPVHAADVCVLKWDDFLTYAHHLQNLGA